MHGSILVQFQKFVTQKLGVEVWNELLAKSGLDPKKLILSVEQYPVNEIVRLLNGATKVTLKPPQVVLEEFGEFLGLYLMQTYGKLLPSHWKTLEVVEREDSQIYQVLKFQEANTLAARLVTSRPSENEVIIEYSSPRKMCSVGVGVIRGIARHFGERVTISQPQCMLHGSHCCSIHVQLVKSPTKNQVAHSER